MFRILLKVFGWVMLACTLTVLVWVVVFAVRIIDLRTHNPRTTAFMANTSQQPIQRWIPLEEIAPVFQQAVIVAEDPRFHKHIGVDWRMIKRAVQINWRKGKIVRGASTLSMQLAKNLYLGRERSYWRKLREVSLAVLLDFLLTKERIFEIYLNIAEWGPDIYGAEAAAEYHFNKHASDIDFNEATMLASLLPNPNLAANDYYKDRFKRARRLIRSRLIRKGYKEDQSTSK